MKDFLPVRSSSAHKLIPDTSSRATPLILLIDDDRASRIQIRRFLERESYQIVEAANGTEGLDAFKRLKPDMVMLDAIMPDIDGFRVCTQLQTLPGSSHIPILMITGLDDEKSVDRAFSAGAADYVTKPVHWAVLRQRVKRLIQQAQVVKQLEAATRLLEQLSLIDELTQLGNRRHFDVRLEHEWQRMAREQASLSLILCDIDFFRRYNEAEGPVRGDSCLRRVAATIKSIARRPADLAARYGGEEFGIVLPNTPRKGAIHLAEKIRRGLQVLHLAHPDSSVSPWVTLSIGVASAFPHRTPHYSSKDLLAAADSALYEAKAAGRDRFAYCELAPTRYTEPMSK